MDNMKKSGQNKYNGEIVLKLLINCYTKKNYPNSSSVKYQCFIDTNLSRGHECDA